MEYLSDKYGPELKSLILSKMFKSFRKRLLKKYL